MVDFRPVAYISGMLSALLGLTMVAPMAMDMADGDRHWRVFLESGLLTIIAGGLIALASATSLTGRLTIQQGFLITTVVWVILPVFGALPFVIGATEASWTDAYFEAMSGLTTTGSTVFTGLEDLPRGLLLWRAMLQWFGGVGIVVVGMAFLPELRIGGMQIFRSEAFDTMGKVLPRAVEISRQVSVIYLGLTAACILGYMTFGMGEFDALTHALTTVSTGGFSTYDASFGTFSGPLEYVASLFMVLAALPFVRFVQLVNGDARPLFRDSQVRAFLGTVAVLVIATSVVLVTIFPHHWERALREALFNITSIITGTGYASVDYMGWGPLLITMFFFIGLIGGCAGSTACSAKIFRYQLLMSSIRNQISKIYSPHGMFTPRYEGRNVDDAVLNSVMAFFVFFVVTLGVTSVALTLTGLDMVTALSGAATAIANVGPGLGPTIGPSGTFAPLNDTAKWILSAAMLIGRLEVLSVFVLFTAAFWRN